MGLSYINLRTIVQDDFASALAVAATTRARQSPGSV
jgi:hypothetical protein